MRKQLTADQCNDDFHLKPTQAEHTLALVYSIPRSVIHLLDHPLVAMLLLPVHGGYKGKKFRESEAQSLTATRL